MPERPIANEVATTPANSRQIKFRWPAVLAVREAVKSGLFKAEKTEDEKTELLKQLGAKIIAAYNVGRTETPIPGFTLEIWGALVGNGARLAGVYSHSNNRIIISKPSLVSFLHELAHHIQKHRDGSTTETYARNFSLGMFQRATPNLFADAARRGMLMGVAPTRRGGAS